MWVFMQPIRRKFGIVTLVLSCVFAAGWVRSLFVVDSINIKTILSQYFISSGFGKIHLSGTPVLGSPPARGCAVRTELGVVHGKNPEGCGRFEPAGKHQPKWLYDWAGFHVSHGTVHGAEMTLCLVPLWSIVIPLTLISAWLLFSKPKFPKRGSASEA